MYATKAREQFFDLIEQAGHPGTVINIRHRDLPDVVMMSLDEFEGWQETMAIMADPQLVADIKAAEAETETITLDELEASLNLNVRSNHKKKSAKTTA